MWIPQSSNHTFTQINRYFSSEKHQSLCRWSIQCNLDDTFVVKTSGDTLNSKYYGQSRKREEQHDHDVAEQEGMDCEDCESVLSEDSFLWAVENGTFSLENCTDPISSPENKAIQTDLSSVEIESFMIAFLRHEVGLKLRDDFKMSDLKKTL